MMKRTIALLLSLSVFLFAAGCKGNSKTSHGVDIKYFAEMGMFTESELRIGDGLPDISEDENSEFSLYDDQNPPFLSNGAFNFYFDGSAKKPVITKIAGFDTCMGFENGAIIIEVTDALDEQEIKYAERAPGEDELFFLPSGTNRTVIECKSLKNPLIFVFEENALCAVLLG